MGKGIERVPQCHDPARKTLQLALARSVHQHVETRGPRFGSPGPLSKEHGVEPGFQELGEAPPGAWTFPIQTAPLMAKRGPHVLLNQQQIQDVARQRHVRECAPSLGSQLLASAQALQAFDRSCNGPSTTREASHDLSREPLRRSGGQHAHTLPQTPCLLGPLALWLLRRSADSVARFFGLLGRHTVDRPRAAARPLLLLLAGLGLVPYDR
jgi:hypothetical protein